MAKKAQEAATSQLSKYRIWWPTEPAPKWMTKRGREKYNASRSGSSTGTVLYIEADSMAQAYEVAEQQTFRKYQKDRYFIIGEFSPDLAVDPGGHLVQLYKRSANEYVEQKSASDQRAMPEEQPGIEDRLIAKPGAKEAFDELLRLDGFINHTGNYVSKARKGKGVILADWDAVVDRFGLMGYGNNDAALHRGLTTYLKGLSIDKRPSRLREHQPYKIGLIEARKHLRDR